LSAISASQTAASSKARVERSARPRMYAPWMLPRERATDVAKAERTPTR
jgi:hypothetical protein